MRVVKLTWSDTEGVSVLLPAAGLWPDEVQDISAALVNVGYTAITPEHFISIVQPNPTGPRKLAVALEGIGYRAVWGHPLD